MGIADRHYYRDQPAPGAVGGVEDGVRGGLSSISMWSVNTWLIVLCVAVFVIDGMLPQRAVETGRVLIRSNVQHYDPEQVVVDPTAGVQLVQFDLGQQTPVLPLLAFKGGPAIPSGFVLLAAARRYAAPRGGSEGQAAELRWLGICTESAA